MSYTALLRRSAGRILNAPVKRFLKEKFIFETYQRLIYQALFDGTQLMEIVKLEGKDQRLYHLVAHLVMDEDVLRYNLNYPYKTSPDYRWYIGTEGGNTIGFIPVKLDGEKAVVNNYYIADDDGKVLSALLKEIIQTLRSDFDIEAIVQTRHIPTFEKCGFPIMLYWKRYVKMKMDKLAPEDDKAATI